MFAIRHEIQARIDDQKQFIDVMLGTYSGMLDQWEHTMIDEFRKESKEASGGDPDIESDYFSQLCRALDDTGIYQSLFYNTMLVMVYAYYESMLGWILKYEGGKQKRYATTIINSICKLRGIELSQDSKADVDFMNKTVCILRNQICHNNNGTPSNEGKLRQIANENNDVDYEKGIVIVNKGIVDNALCAAHAVLRELAEKLGYKTKLI